MVSKVGIAKGAYREENITNALKLIEPEIREKINRKKRVIIKPNLGFLKYNLANTKSESVEAILKFLRQFYTKKIIIAESTTFGETPQGFKEYGYDKLQEKYDVELIDLNYEKDFSNIKIYDGRLSQNISVKVSNLLLKSDFIISICPPKTHDSVIVTLGIKNVAMAAIKKKDRSKIHQGPKAINLTIAKLAKKLWPSLTIIDGFEAMEGNGPVYGEKVDLKLALASADALSADTIMSIIMGFNPSKIGYLKYCQDAGLGTIDPLKISILGENYRKMVRSFKPHHLYNLQLDWEV